MLARVARYQVDPDRCDEAVQAFLEAGRELGQLAGLESAYVLVDSESGATMTVTLWASRAALDASETRAASLRQRASRSVEAEVESVVVFDVVRELGA
jgi:heme-degrading monooxygenase HmoA